MALALESRAMKDDIMAGDTPKARARSERLKSLGTAKKLTKHSMLDELDGFLSPPDLEDYFIFTLVRNPWDRMVSYYHWLRNQTFKHPAVTLAVQLDFAEFVAAPLTAQSISTSNYARYVTDASGAERCNLFIRLEHLDEDIAPLENFLEFRMPRIERVNASARDSNHRIYYSDQTAELVAEMCKTDIQRFGYAF